LFLSWTWRRLSPWRSFTQPVYQLEGLAFGGIRGRVKQIKRRKRAPAWLITLAFFITQICLAFAVASLVFWFAPPKQAPDLVTLWSEDSGLINVAVFVAYAVVTAFLEPFYVAAGFAMYLNRRAQLEAWDVEQELRRAFAV